MKTILILSLFAIAFGSPIDDEATFIDKELKAEEECGKLFPTKENPREKIMLSIVAGERLSFKNNSEWANLNCVLSKIGFFDEKNNMRAPSIFKFSLKSLPEMAKYSSVFMTQLFQIYRTTKDMDDQCLKAFVAYYRFCEALFVYHMADYANNELDIKGTIKKAIEEGQPIPEQFKNDAKEFFKTTDKIFRSVIRGVNETETTTIQSSPVQNASPAAPVSA